VTGKVRALQQEWQDRRKAELDAHQRDVRFAVRDEVLLDTEHAPLPSRWLLSPRWLGPLLRARRQTVNTYCLGACVPGGPVPNTYCLDVPATWRVFP
jgi:hypothetical protein